MFRRLHSTQAGDAQCPSQRLRSPCTRTSSYIASRSRKRKYDETMEEAGIMKPLGTPDTTHTVFRNGVLRDGEMEEEGDGYQIQREIILFWRSFLCRSSGRKWGPRPSSPSVSATHMVEALYSGRVDGSRGTLRLSPLFDGLGMI